MNTLKKLLLFTSLIVMFTSCLVHPRPYKNWYGRRNGHRFDRGVSYNRGHGTSYWGRRLWVRQR